MHEPASPLPPTPPPPTLPRLLTSRYELRELLHGHADIATCLGRDLEHDGKDVVIKYAPLAGISAGTLTRLEHEAAILSALERPELATRVHIDRADQLVFMVMPYVPGISLGARLASSPLDTDEALGLGVELAKTLTHVHNHGILHRDIKPSNIIVNLNPPLTQAVLIDFGLARAAFSPPPVGQAWAFTAYYAAPEQAGLIDHGVDERSDLYALGIVLYEALCGTPPFQGDQLNEVLHQHLTRTPPSLRTHLPQVPPVFEALILRLLAKDPRDRYQSAESLLHDLEAIRTACRQGHDRLPVVLGKHDRRSNLTEPAFVARERELAELESLLNLARAGQGAVALLEAPSGVGKTRLLDELTRRSRQHEGAMLLRGQGVDQSASRPYQILVGIAHGMLETARNDSHFKARLNIALADHLASLCAVLPELCELFSYDSGSLEAPEAFGETRSIGAICAFLKALGSSDRPVLYLIDDCQWADALSLKLLTHWQQLTHNDDKTYTSLVLAFRSEETDSAHPLRSLRGCKQVTLRNLNRQEVLTMLTSMAGPLPPEALDSAIDLSACNPFMATAVLRGMVETGALVPGTDSWVTVPEVLSQLQASRRAAVVLARRLEGLPQSALHLLSVGAVLGKVFDIGLATALAQQTPAAVLAAVALARRRQLIWEDAQGSRCRFVHDKIREALIERLPLEKRRLLHRHAAEHMEVHAPDQYFELSYHYDSAGESQRALPFALKAARQARSQSALAIAEEQYQIAARGVTAVQSEEAVELTKGLGDVLMLQGRYGEAQLQMEKAQALAIAPLTRADIETSLGELAFKRGDMAQASKALERALTLLGRSVPQTSTTMFLMLVWELWCQTLHSLFPTLFVTNRRRTVDGPTSLTLRIYSRLAYAFWFQRGRVACAWAHLRNMNLAECYAESPYLAQAYSEHSPVTTTLPWFSRGIKYALRSYAIRERLRDVWGQGQSLGFYGVALYSASRFEEAAERCREAVKLLTRTGDRWECNTASWHLAYSYYRMGHLREACSTAQQVFYTASEIGDYSSAGIALSVWSKAGLGQVPADLISQELNRTFDDVHTRIELLQAQGIRLLYANDTAAAVNILREAQALVHSSGLRQEYVVATSPWLLTALRRHAESLDMLAPQRSALLREAEAQYGLALRLAKRYRNNLPHTLREGAFLAAWRQEPAKARSLLDESMAVASGMQSRHEYALSQALRGRLGALYMWGEHNDDSQQAAQALKNLEQQPLPKPSRSDDRRSEMSALARLDMLLEAGRSLATALTRRSVYEALQQSAEKLFRSTRCLVLSTADHHREPSLVAGNASGEFSRQLVEQAITEGRAVVMDEHAGLSTSDSLLLTDIRAALCVPVCMRQVPVACLYVSHNQVGRLFNSDEMNLGQYLSVLAGVALENADGFAQLQALNESLALQAAERKRVADELRVARDSAEEANRAKTQFLANMSHEIRTPLNAILGFSQLLATSGSSESEQQHFIDTITRNGLALSQLIDDILDLAKVEAGHLTLEAVPMSLPDLIDDVQSSLRVRAAEKGIDLRVYAQGQIPATIVSDPNRLRQVLFNIVGNAIKFTSEGSVEVSLHLVRRDIASQSLLYFVVKDTGCGIPTEAQGRLFQAFTQADNSITRRYGGTGLGLVLARRLAQQLGGSVELTQSVSGQGSIFTICVATGSNSFTESIANLAPEERGPVQVADLPDLAGCRILVADDSADNRSLVCRLLKMRGAAVDMVTNGAEAVEQACKERYDVVLMDMQMPLVDGYSATAQLREQGYGRPIIALTAHAMHDERDRSLKAGCNTHVAKPIEASKLLQTVARFTQREPTLPPTPEA